MFVPSAGHPILRASPSIIRFVTQRASVSEIRANAADCSMVMPAMRASIHELDGERPLVGDRVALLLRLRDGRVIVGAEDVVPAKK